MTPHRLFVDLQHIAFLARQAQDDIGKHVGKIVQPFEVQFSKLPPLEDYETIAKRTQRISQRNFELVKKILDLRSKVVSIFYFSSRKSEKKSEEEYELCKRDLHEARSNSLNKFFRLKKEKMAQGSPQESEQGKKTPQKKIENEAFISEREKINSALEVLSKETRKCRLELELIEEFIQKKRE